MNDTDLKTDISKKYLIHRTLFGIGILASLYIVSRHNYLVFHTLAEFFSIVVALSLFLIFWNTREIIENKPLILLGIAYLFIGSIDLMHTLSYKGMGVLGPETGANPATQLWIFARYIESFTLCIFTSMIIREVNICGVILFYTAVISLGLLSIFYWANFPVCYVDGVGLTKFKILSEYLICAILIMALFFLKRNKGCFDETVYRCMIIAIILTVFAELSFTFYVSVYGLSNLFGHYFKIISFYFVYRALIQSGLRRPYSLLYKRTKESARRFQKFFENAGVYGYQIDTDGKILDMNTIVLSKLGYSRDDLIGQPLSKLYTDESFEKAKRYFQKWKVSGQVDNAELSIKTKDGKTRWVLLNADAVKDDQGNILHSTSIQVDITDRKQMEENLQERQAFLKRIIDQSPFATWISDAEGTLQQANPALKKYLNLTDEQLVGKYNVLDDPLVEKQGLLPLIRSVFEEGKTIHFTCDWDGNDIPTMDLKGSKYVSIEATMFPIFDHHNQLTNVVLNWIDITDRKQAERALQDSETNLRTLLNTIPDLVWLKNPDGAYITCNKKFERFFGAKEDEIKGKTDYDFVDKDLADFFREKDKVAMAVGSPSVNEEEVIYADDGHREQLETIKTPMHDSQGNLIGVLGIARNITDRKEMEERLHFLSSITEGVTDSIIVTNTDFGIIYANQAAENLFGYTFDELEGKSPDIFNVDPDATAIQQEIYDTIKKGEAYYGESLNRRKDGGVFHCGYKVMPLKNKQGEIKSYVGVQRDITDRKKLEEQIQKAQKMESIGNLAGGIAHDFNNILFPIIGMAEILLEDLPDGSNERDNAEEIFKAGKRGSDLVKQILAFSRQAEHKLIPVRVQQVLKEVLTLTRATIPSYIEINQDIQPDCGLVMVDPTQIHQVAMNVITNAFHALDSTGGTITIHLKEIVLEGNELYDRVLTPGRYVLLSISDTGHGMSDNVKAKIFEPYFTTKEPGKGTGIGLAVVYGIIKTHNGDIEVHSEIGKGTTFNIYLPLISRPDDKESSGVPEKFNGGNERILIVDDEESVVRLERQMLERLGYQVTSRVNSLEALEAFRARPYSFDLVISDMTMPNMTGDQLATEVKSIRSDTPIIICTGFSERINRDKIKGKALDGLLMKPIIKAEMAKMVRKVLDEVNSRN